MIKHQLTLLFLALPLLGFQIPQNQTDKGLLNTLTDEQKVNTYSLAKSIGSHSNTSKIKLIFNNGSSCNYKIDTLLSAFKTIAQDAENSDEPNKLTEHLKVHTRLKIKEIKEIKLFILDESGERIIKFESPGIKVGKRKIGPFEIPSNKILIVSPKITYY